jgi:Tol biopolymer transport system component
MMGGREIEVPRSGRAVGALILFLSLIALMGVPTAFASVMTVRVSVDTGDGDANGASYRASISADGRYVAFVSRADDLVPGDANGLADVFVRDLVAGTTVRGSVDTSGGDPNGPSAWPILSTDGRYLAFESSASDLVQGDTRRNDVFVRDLVTGTTTRVSVNMNDATANGVSKKPSITADGRFVAFQSLASDLVVGDRDRAEDVFVRDLVSGTTVRASVSVDGGDPNGDLYWNSYAASINADGRYVAFASFADNLVEGDGNGTDDVFVRDLIAGTTTRVSIDMHGGDPNGYSNAPSISSDGRHVAFQSSAFDLVAGDKNPRPDVFVRDLMARTTSRVSVDAQGGDSNDSSHFPVISADGRYVAFESFASDLVVGDGNRKEDVFLRNLQGGTTVRVSVDTAGADANGVSKGGAISGDGRAVAFESTASDLVTGDGNGVSDAFARLAS